jgi:hypothetical protein
MALLTAERIYSGERYPAYRNCGKEIDVSSLDLHYRPEIPGDRVITVPAHHSTDVAEGSRSVPAMAGQLKPADRVGCTVFQSRFPPIGGGAACNPHRSGRQGVGKTRPTTVT